MWNLFCFKTCEFEWAILDFFDRFKSDLLNFINQYMSELFGSFGIIVMLFLIYWCISKEKGINIIFTTISGMLFNNLIKGIVARSRPFEIEGKEYLRKLNVSKDGATGSSFPSGHSMNASTFYTSICCNWRARRFRPLKIISGFLIFLVGVSRIYLGVHFPTDVIFGILFGIIVAIVMAFLQEILGDKKNYLYIIVLVAFSLVMFFTNMDRDFYKSLGILVGFVPCIIMENKIINFSTNTTLKNKIIRVILGILIVGGVYFVYSIVPIDLHNNYCFTFVMHVLFSYLGIFVVPLIFSKIESNH